MNNNKEPWDYNKIISDKNLFYDTVYTPLSKALEILEERQKDENLKKKIEELLNGDIPDGLKFETSVGVIFRQVATPNYEIRWFIDITKNNGLKPVFFEYHNDKFTSNNFYKHSLGQLRIHKNKNNKNGENIEEKITIVDFNKFNGKKLKDVLTIKGESLLEFHKKMFKIYYEDVFDFYDGSNWFKKNGPTAISYYTNFIILFSYYGILFENFLLDGDECEFTKKVFLPAFEKASNILGIKPLIVPIPPMDKEIEENTHWHSYCPKIKNLLD